MLTEAAAHGGGARRGMPLAMKVRIVLNGGAEIVYGEVWSVHCEQRGAEFAVSPVPYQAKLDVTASDPIVIEPRTRSTVYVGLKP